MDPERRYRAWCARFESLTELDCLLVACRSESVVGFADAGRMQSSSAASESGTGEIRAVYVDPRIWRARVGRMLVEACLMHLTPRGFTSACARVLRDNQAAKSFFESQGWRHADHAEGPVPTCVYLRSIVASESAVVTASAASPPLR